MRQGYHSGLILLVLFAFFISSEAPAAEEVADPAARREIESLKQELAEIKARLQADESGILRPAEPSRDPAGQKYHFGEYWDNGLHFKEEKGRFDLRVGGRIHVDGAFFDADRKLEATVADIKSGWEVRHPRIYLKGRIYGNFLYKVQYTFSDDTIGDAYIGMQKVPVLGTVILGKAARAFGCDPGPSSNYTLFMEYADTIIFGAGKQMGLAAGSPILDSRVSWAAQIFQFVDGKGVRTEDDYNLNLRLTGLPVYSESGRRMAHLGISSSFRSRRDDFEYKSRPEVHLAPYFVDTGPFDIDSATIFALEGALVEGPFALEGEYYRSFLDRKDGLDNLDFFGFYLQTSFFVTGESRGTQYQTAYGEFDSPVYPLHPFDPAAGGWGAWQLAARYSYLHLNDRDIRGGIMGDLTVGLNWYLNPNLRWMLNYIHSSLNGSGEAEILATRFAVNI